MSHFSKNFYWGSATSSHQIEGNTHNNWSVWEKKHAERLARDAREKWTPQIRERFLEMFTPENYISGEACDHYNRYEEDLDLVKAGGQNAFRFSLEWARIEPEEGVFNEEALAHYKDVIAACHARGIEPFVTLWHWTHPLWLEERGGVLAKDFVTKFTQYAQKVTETFGGDVHFYMTLNEPTSVIGNAYLAGSWPPQKKNPFLAWRAMRNLGAAHRSAYDVMHKVQENIDIGFTHIYVFNEPYNKNNPLDRAVARAKNFFDNDLMQRYGRGKQDFIALQYYFHSRMKFPWRSCNDNEVISDLAWEIYPEGLYHAIKDVEKFNLPIHITENGLADADDTRRTQFLVDTLDWIEKAIIDGADVHGYLYWSLLDNFEWDKGYWPRFGLIDIDYATGTRTPRESYGAYRDMIQKYQQ